MNNNHAQRRPAVQKSLTIDLTEDGSRTTAFLENQLIRWHTAVVNEIKNCQNAPHDDDEDIIAEAILSPKIFPSNLQAAPGLNTLITCICNVELFNNIDQERIRNNWTWKKTIKKVS